MRPQHDGPVAVWHTYAHDDPDHAALSTRTLQAHMVNLSNMGEGLRALPAWWQMGEGVYAKD